MKTQIAVALISAFGGILATLAGRIPIDKIRSKQARSHFGVPEIMRTKWQAEWSYDDGRPTVNDEVTLESWTTANEFKGFGEITSDSGRCTYQISGEVSPMRIVSFTYKAARYPTEAYFGMACLQLSTGASALTGPWVGFDGRPQTGGSEAFELYTGKVRMKKIKDLDGS